MTRKKKHSKDMDAGDSSRPHPGTCKDGAGLGAGGLKDQREPVRAEGKELYREDHKASFASRVPSKQESLKGS